eukprot:11497086-Alexandrium_andersonii.AAC.1
MVRSHQARLSESVSHTTAPLSGGCRGPRFRPSVVVPPSKATPVSLTGPFHIAYRPPSIVYRPRVGGL